MNTQSDRSRAVNAKEQAMEILQPNVIIGYPLASFRSVLNPAVQNVMDAVHGKIIGGSMDISRVGDILLKDSFQVVVRAEGDVLCQMVPFEDFQPAPPGASADQLLKVLAHLANADFSALLNGGCLNLPSSSGSDGFYFRRLTVLRNAVMITDDIQDPCYIHPDDVALTNFLFLSPAETPQHAAELQPEVDLILRIFAKHSLDEYASDHEYAPVSMEVLQAS